MCNGRESLKGEAILHSASSDSETKSGQTKLTFQGQTKLTFQGQTKLTFQGQTKLTFQGQTKLTFQGQTKLTFQGQTKLTFQGQTKLTFQGQTKLTFDGPSKREREEGKEEGRSDPYNDVIKPSDIYYPIYGTLTVRSRESPNVTSRIHFIQTVPSNSYSQFNL
ncbi:hypothetical protein M8J77_005530 [Diaphorina citri]|nr:hypothetical protein M8J77_005530 [Diaphorina citri]